jgi:hypothetical protein
MHNRTLWMAIVALAAAACDEQAGFEESFTFAFVTDLTGPAAASGPLAAVTAAVESANAVLADGGHTYRFSVLPADSGSTPKRASTFARELIELDGARAVIVGSAAEAVELNEDLNYGGGLEIPIVCAACFDAEINDCSVTDPSATRQAALRDRSQFLFRTVPTSDTEASLIVERLLLTRGNRGDVNGDGVFKVGLYRPESRAAGFPRQMAAALARLAAPLWPGETLILETVTFDDEADSATYNCDSVMEQLLDAENSDVTAPSATDRYFPDAILGEALPAFDACMVGAYRLANSSVRYVQRASFRHPTVIELLGVDAEGSSGISPPLVASNASGAYVAEALRDSSGQPLSLLDANYYDAAMSLVLATLTAAAKSRVDPANLSGDNLAIGLTQISDGTVVGAMDVARAVGIIDDGGTVDYDGASGPVDFTPPSRINPTLCDAANPDSGGDVVSPWVTFEVRDGRVQETGVFDCLAGPDCPSR